MKTLKTRNCIYCFKPAECWCGHVVNKKGNKILAGWCKKHLDVMGFFGQYCKKYGVEKDIL